MPNDSSGQPSPLISWQVGRGIIESPMEWTRDCMLFFHSSVKLNKEYAAIIVSSKYYVQYLNQYIHKFI